MRIALFSDIHANVVALREALQRSHELGADRAIVAGDLVGKGPYPDEVVRLLRSCAIPAIYGNLDRRACEENLGLEAAGREQDRWTYEHLSSSQRAWLCGLPGSLRLSWNGLDVLVVHGSPKATDDYVYPSLTEAGLSAKLSGPAPDVMVCGHSHIPFAKSVGRTMVVNCGAVGLSIDGDPRGSFVLVQVDECRRISATIHRFDYDRERVVADLLERGVPSYDAVVYTEGIDGR